MFGHAKDPVNDAQIAQWTQMLQSDPQFANIRRTMDEATTHGMFGDGTNLNQPDPAIAFNQYLASKGINLKDNGLTVDAQGNLTRDHTIRNGIIKALALAGAGAAGGAALGAVGGGAPTAGLTGTSALGSGVMAPGEAMLGAGNGALTSGIGVSGMSNVAAGGSLMSKMLGSKGLSNVGSALGGAANQMAKNRSETGDLTQGYDKLRLQAQQDQRANEQDAMTKLGQVDYITGGGNPFHPATPISNGGQPLPDLGYGPKAPGADQVAGANSLKGQLLARLAPGGSYMPTDPTTYTKAGTGEKALNWGGTIGSILGGFGKGV